MAPFPYFGSALAALVVAFVVFRVIVRRDYLRSGRLSPLSTALEYVAILAWVAFGWLNVTRDWPAVHVGVAQEVAGWVLFVGGWAVFLASLLRLGVRRSHGLAVDALRQTGMYGLSRNPQATAFLLAMVGYLVLWPTWRNVGVLAVVVVLAHLMIRTEEDHLRAAFGPEYERYCERVPRYVGPRRPSAVWKSGAIALLLAVCIAPAADRRAADRRESQEETGMLKELLAIENGAMERWRNGDPMGWTEISAPEVTYVDPFLAAPIIGLAAYTEYLDRLKGKVHYDVSEFINPAVAAHGDAAVLTYNYFGARKEPDGSLSGESHWNTTEVYSRLGGTWEIIHTHWSYVGQKLPESVEVPVPVEAGPQRPEGVAAEILALEAGAMERWRKGDPRGFLEISAPGVTYFDTGTPGRLDGRAALEAEYAPRKGKIRYDVMEFIAPTVQVHGDLAVLFYRFFSTRLNADGSVASRTPWNCTEVFARTDDSWEIVHTHWSFIHGRPPGP